LIFKIVKSVSIGELYNDTTTALVISIPRFKRDDALLK